MTTVGEAISRVRNTLKAVKDDPFLTDRTIYYSIVKYGQTLLKREDDRNKLMKISTLFTTLPFVELIDVDKIEAGCTGVYSGCYFKRTKEKLPQLFDGAFGPLLRTVSSIDGSIPLYRTEPGTFVSISKSTSFKYNKKHYFWYLNGYLYLPNVDWEAIRVEGIFEGDKSDFLCPTNENSCVLKQDMQLPFPEYLFSEIEQMVLQELTMTVKLPQDQADDSQNVLR
jgi:hypothetical protein